MEFAGQPNRNKTTSGRSAKILQSSPSLLQWSKRRDLAHLHHLICRESIAGNSCNSFLRRRGMLQDVTSMSQASKRHSVKTSLAGPSLPIAPSANATCHEYVQTVRLCPTLSDSRARLCTLLCFSELLSEFWEEKSGHPVIAPVSVEAWFFQETRGKAKDELVQIHNYSMRIHERVQTPAMSAKWALYPAAEMLRMTLTYFNV